MLVICPGCAAVYRLDRAVAPLLACHRCGHEFSFDPQAERRRATTPSTPPMPQQHHIWPWLLAALLVLAGIGIGAQKDALLADPWLRSVLINLGLPLAVRNDDWRINADSLRSRWLARDDGSRVFVIEGSVRNLLQCELPPPRLAVAFFAADGKLLLQRTLAITQPPLMQAIRHTPYLPPPQDQLPVAAGGSRSFTLVVKAVPDQAVKFTLSAVATSP